MSKKQIALFSLSLVLVALLACRDDGVRPVSEVVGTWGGQHVVLVADESGGTLEYDCAHGEVEEKLVVDNAGNVEATGTHTREQGGPMSVDEEPEVHPARYTGHVSGSTLTLTITLTDTGDVLGPYTLRRGNYGTIYKCL